MDQIASSSKNSRAVAQGLRIRQLRSITCLSRRAFSRKHGIPLGTLQNWEDGRYGGLSDQAGRRLVALFAAENIFCSVEWLLDGVEPGPSSMLIKEAVSAATRDMNQPVTESGCIAEELTLFHRLHNGAVDMIVADNHLAPWLSMGDHVAGVRCFAPDVVLAVGKLCIVQMSSGRNVIRQLEASHEPGRFNLILPAPYADTIEPSYHVEVFSVAPIVWIRKKTG